MTSLHDKKGRWGKRRHQSMQPLRRGAQRRGDALPDWRQQGPRSDALSALISPPHPPSPPSPDTAPINCRCLYFVPANCSPFEDVQPRCFPHRSVLPARRLRFLVDRTYLFVFFGCCFCFFLCFFFLLSALTETELREAAGENMCERRSAEGMGCLGSLEEKKRGLNTN